MKNRQSTPAQSRRLKRRAPAPMALEPRVMFDGAAVDAAAAATAAAERAAQEATRESSAAAERQNTTADRPQALLDGGRSENVTEIVFIDGSLPNARELAAKSWSGAKVVILDPSKDAFQQMRDVLSGYQGLKAIHILSHGSEGVLTLGGLTLNKDSLSRFSADLNALGDKLSADGDLLLYGCGIGAGKAGQSFIAELARLTQADVAASTNATGSAAKGGDWVLEAATGAIESRALAFMDGEQPFLLGNPLVASVDDTTYVEGSGPVVVDNNITITGGDSYDGKYIRFSVTNGQTTDILSLTNAANVNASGAISFSGSSVYLGNGSGRDIIGTIDATENGQGGKALKINFVSTFTNSGFESGSLTGWTAMNQVINLGTTVIAGFTSPNDGTYPSNAGDDNAYPTTPGSYNASIDSSQYTEGSKSLRLVSSGITTASGYDVVHGPAVYSDIFRGTAGDKIYFDWRAMYGDDAYDVYGYILNTDTGATTTVLDATGNTTSSTNWATASATIPTTGNYRFVFVAGTYDLSGGQAAGASLYIDNVRVYGSKVNDAVVTAIARQVAFEATSDNPVTSSTRVFSVTAVSATGGTSTDTGLINMTAVNDAPVLGGASQTVTYTENGAALAIDTAITVTDPDSPANFNGGWVQAQITSNSATEDQLSVLNQGNGAGQIGVSGSNVYYAGTQIGTIDASLNGSNGAALRINLNGNASAVAVQALARTLAYRNVSDTPSTASRGVTFTVNDGGNTGTGGAKQATRAATVIVKAVDDPTVLTLSGNSRTYLENDTNFFVDAGLTISDIDNTTVNGAKVTISTGFQSGEDRLRAAGTGVTWNAVTNTGTFVKGGTTISYSYDVARGVLTLSGTGTLQDYQDALRAVQYNNISENPNAAARTIDIVLGNAIGFLAPDGKMHYYEFVSQPNVKWTDARVAADGMTFQGMQGYLATITTATENDFVLSKVAGNAWIGASDAYAEINRVKGTSYTTQSQTEGQWYWVSGPEAGTLISTGNGTPVAAAGAYTNWNPGEPNNSGSNENYAHVMSWTPVPGQWNDLPDSGGSGQYASTGYIVEYNATGSSVTFAKSVVVTPVRKNDAPVNDTPVAVPAIQEDGVNNTGSLVSSFLRGSDADGNALGVAVTAVDNANGKWQYSTNGGASWTDFGTPSDSIARLLAASDYVRFVPNQDYSGTATITYRAWDRTSGVAGNTVDLSGANSYGTYKPTPTGDETAYSATKQTATLTVTAVNDAPVLTPANPVLDPINEDAVSNSGQTVASILGTSVADVDAGALRGMAITGLNAGNGKWQYSLDGTTWVDVGSVSSTGALLLRATDSLRFVPDGKNGTSASISYKAWDQSSGTAGSKASTANSGGSAAFSTAADTASIVVGSVNDAPVLGNVSNPAGISEEAINNAGQTVASLYGANLTDVDTGSLQGIAITGASNGGATGKWQYSTDGGTSWFDIGSPSAAAALLLKAGDRVRFNPDGFKGGTATLSLRGWDQTSGTASNGAIKGTADVSGNGGSSAFSAAERTISLAVAEVNDAPQITQGAGNTGFTENGGAVTVGGGLQFQDDGGYLNRATVTIGTGFTTGDTLAVGNLPAGLSASYNAATGILTLTGNGTVADYLTALNSVTFNTLSEDPTVNSATRTLVWQVRDDTGLSSATSSSTLTLTPLADKPVVGNVPASWSYTEDDGARVLAPTLTLTDPDDTQLSGARVFLGGAGYLNDGRELLSAVTTGTQITASFDMATGVLTLSGVDSVANYQRVLRSVTYKNTADYDNPNNLVDNITLDAVTRTRTLSWEVTDANSDGAGAATSVVQNTTITLVNANELPQVDNIQGNTAPLDYTEGGDPATLEGVLNVEDDSGQPGGSANIAGGMVKITNGLDAQDQLGFFDATALGVAGWTQSGDAVSGSLTKGAVEIRYAYDAATGTITLTTQAGAASKGDYTEVMQRIGFVSTGDDPTASSPTRTLIWRVVDNLGAESQVTSAQTTLVRITAVNDAPTITPATGGTVTFTEGGSPVKAAPLLTTDDADDSAATGATVEITGNAHGDDLLAIAGSALAGTGISLDASSTATRLVLVGQASRATYENVLRQITFSNSSADPAGSGGTRTLSWTITDDFGSRETDFPTGNDADPTKLTSTTATSTITIAPRNDAPTVSGLPGSAASYTEGGSAAVLAGSIALGDVDDANLSGARIWISGGFTAGDTLSYGTLPGGVTAAYNAATGLLTFSGTASRADYATLLNSVKFSSSSADPTAAFASREISWQVTDADASTAGADKLPSATGTSRVEITAVDTPAQLSGLPANTDVTFTEKGSAVAVAPNAVLSDADDTTLEGLVVTIGAGHSPGDVLAVTADLADSGITASFNAATGTLTLSGHASLADYQAVLRSVVFSNATDNPSGNGATRTLNWSLVGSFGSRLGDAAGTNDGDAGVTTANAGSSQINIAARNDAPTLSFGHNANLDAATVVFEQGGSEVFVLDASNPNTVGSATLADVDDNYISSASVTISGNRGSGDTLSVATPAGWTRSGNELTTGSGAKVQVAYNSATGTLTLTTSSGQVSKAEFESLLEHVQYKNSTNSPTASGASRQLTWTVTDANAAGDGAKSVSATSFLVIRDRNDAPEITPASTSVTYTEGDIEVDLPNLTVADPDPDEIVTATLTLSHPDAGVLTVVPGAHYDAGTGVWTFSGSVADVNAALALVKFIPEPNNDVNVTVSLAVADGGEDGAAVAHASIAVNVTAVNDAPELTPANPVLPGINEDATSNNGATVGSFRGTVHDVDTGTQPGIAITGLTSGNGHWEYQVAGGAWTAFPAGLAETQAVLLADTDRVRFVPNGENATTATFTYRAWDGSTGHAGDVVDASHGGNSEAFSNASDQASIIVAAVNDAPELDTTTPVLIPLPEDNQNSDGHDVADLLDGQMSDVDDGALQGIAITGLDSGNGTWEYSLDGGNTWHAVGTVSENNALLLRDTDKVRFVPNGQNATDGTLSFRAWDQSVGHAGDRGDASHNGGTTAFSAGQNTATISISAENDAPVLAPDAPELATQTENAINNEGAVIASLLGNAISDVDIGAVGGMAITSLDAGNGVWEYSLDGGTTWTAITGVDATHALLLADSDRIRFVPDGKNATTASFTYRAWDQTSGTAGSLVTIGATGGTTAFSNGENTASITITDVNDAPVLAPANPVLTTLDEDQIGNGGQTLASLLGTSISDVDIGATSGVAITGLSSGNGAWEYSLDGGATWVSVGTVSENHALLLKDSDKIRFVPDGKNETTANFTYRAWDRSAGNAGAYADASSNGGDTAFSADKNTARIVITAVNDAPINDVLPTIGGDHRGDGTLRQDSVIRVDPGQWHDVDLGDPATTYRYQWQIADDAGGTGLRDIPGATGEAFNLGAEHIGKFIRLKVVGSDGKEETIAYSGFTKVSNLDPVSTKPLAVRETTESVPIRFTVPAESFADGDPEDTLHFSATLANGKPLPSWLTFDPVTRTFSGTPSGADVGEIRVRVIADDRGNAPAHADFTLRVLSIPVKSDPPVKPETGGGTGGSPALPEGTGLPGGLPGIPGTGPGLPGIPSGGPGLPGMPGGDGGGGPGTGAGGGTSGWPGGTGGGTGGGMGGWPGGGGLPSGGGLPGTSLPGGTDGIPSSIDVPGRPGFDGLGGSGTPGSTGTTGTAGSPGTGGTAGGSGLSGGANAGSGLADGRGSGGFFGGFATAGSGTGDGRETANAGTGGAAGRPGAAVANGNNRSNGNALIGNEGLTRQEGFQVLVRSSNDDSQALRLGRNLDDQDLPVGRQFKVTVPVDAFVHTKIDAVVMLSANLSDGAALPPWVEFDAAKGIFRGVPPIDYEGSLEIVVTARDGAGNIVSQRFRIRIGEGVVGKVSFSEQLRSAGSQGRHAERMGLLKLARAAQAKRAA